MSSSSVQRELVPGDFIVPDSLEHSLFRLKPLTQAEAEADYRAVMDSREELQQLFAGDWPSPDFTLAANREDIATLEDQFAARKTFTYTVLDPAGQEVLGCVYLESAEQPGFDAAVIYWTRTGGALTDATLAEALSEWIEEAWPFTRVQFLR